MVWYNKGSDGVILYPILVIEWVMLLNSSSLNVLLELKIYIQKKTSRKFPKTAKTMAFVVDCICTVAAL